MRTTLFALSMLLCSSTSALAQVSVAIGVPGISIGINVPVYPQLVRIPGYPVYYAPRLYSNYFFYDGLYWVYQYDNWYVSSWYNGPWDLVSPYAVPLVVLRIPVRYYRHPPAYFHGWPSNAPPRWGEHWGSAWDREHHGWDHYDRRMAPAPAPLPKYQRQYSGPRYPSANQQQALEARHYRYTPQDPAVRQRYEAQRGRGRPAPPPPQGRGPGQDHGRGSQPRGADRN